MSVVPTLSIVVGSLHPGTVLFEALRAIERQLVPGIEVIVVDGTSEAFAAEVESAFPWLRLVRAPAGCSLPRLRGLGIAASSGTLVGLLDAWCLIGDGWIVAALHAHASRPEPVMGGGVDLAPTHRHRLRDWAAYLFDYWEYVAPYPSGPTPVLAGNNIVYERSVLPSDETLKQHGFWKAFTNVHLKSLGHGLWACAGLRIDLQRSVSATRFLRSRYHHGRSYAAMRVASAGVLRRTGFALLTPALPALFLFRQARHLLSRPHVRYWFLACVPLLVAYHLSWAWGECCGYLSGPGRSDEAIAM